MKLTTPTWIAIFVALLSLAVGQACNISDEFALEKSLSSLSVEDPELPEFRQRAYRRALLTFAKKSPSYEDLEKVRTKSGYTQAINELIDSKEFISTMKEHHQNHFQLKGSEGGINYDEPANLAAYLIEKDEDFRKILTADFCVNNELEPIACSSFPSEKDQEKFAAGIVTTQAFLVKWAGPFNFRRVKNMFENFACHSYPDPMDYGMTEQEISETVKSFACTNCDTACYNCHRSMNPKAVLFYKFDQLGKYNLSPKPDPKDGEITIRDDMSISEVGDLLKPNVVPRYMNREVTSLRELSKEFANSRSFENCATQRFTNFALGRSATSPVPTVYSFITSELPSNGFRIRDFYRKLLTSEVYIRGLQ